MRRTIIAVVVLGVLAVGGLYAGKARLTGQGSGHSTAATVLPDYTSHSKAELNDLRCDAWLELVSCDHADCVNDCEAKNVGDPTRNESCQQRCDSRVPRKLKRANNRYKCTFDTCNLVDFNSMLNRVRLKYQACQDKNEIYELGEHDLQKCEANCNRMLQTIWSLAEYNYCRNEITDKLQWSCEELGHTD